MPNYAEFLEGKTHLSGDFGFSPLWLPTFLYDFQESLVSWAIRKGRAAIFADCGLGKTPMQLVWAQNVIQKTNGRVLILTPLAVGQQTKREAEKFGIEAARCQDGKIRDARIVITNYQRLHYFAPKDFAGVVCDESSILKNFDGKTKAAITEFMRTLPYRLLCTATAAPNDHVELGTSSEALGELGYMDMLSRFFKANNGSLHPFHTGHPRGIMGGRFRFRGHAERDFWRWVCSWARALRKPSDLGFDDGRFALPGLTTRQHIVKASKPRPGFLFEVPAITLSEQREERRRTLPERCEMAASLVANTRQPAVMWCHLNDEGDTLNRLLPEAVQVSGADTDEHKEEAFVAFAAGDIRVLITKPTIAGFGLNWQHCAHETFFPSHSFEQWYQAIRRCWRFGQTKPVTIDVITSEGESRVVENMERKGEAAQRMFASLVSLMGDELQITTVTPPTVKEEAPSWLC